MAASTQLAASAVVVAMITTSVLVGGAGAFRAGGSLHGGVGALEVGGVETGDAEARTASSERQLFVAGGAPLPPDVDGEPTDDVGLTVLPPPWSVDEVDLTVPPTMPWWRYLLYVFGAAVVVFVAVLAVCYCCRAAVHPAEHRGASIHPL